jgi:hypothetical protein
MPSPEDIACHPKLVSEASGPPDFDYRGCPSPLCDEISVRTLATAQRDIDRNQGRCKRVVGFHLGESIIHCGVKLPPEALLVS